MSFYDLKILHRTVILFNQKCTLYLGRKHNKFSQCSLAHATRTSNSSNTTGSTCNLVSMVRSIGLLKKRVFRQLPPLGFSGIFGDFWYVVEDMFLDQKPSKKPSFVNSGRSTDFSRKNASTKRTCSLELKHKRLTQGFTPVWMCGLSPLKFSHCVKTLS